ncbi:MAG TPA: proton-conducting transporter membrane subunit [Anaerolineales bacterium]|nr:proton-conducting transporter membrane subunit [Anaerolineales bacterium]
MTTTLILLTIGLPWLGAILVWLVGDARPRLQHALAVVFSAAAAVACVFLIPRAAEAAAIRLPLGAVFGELSLVPDGLGVFLSAVATIVGCLAVIFSVDYMRGEAQLGRYYALVLLFIGAMAGLVLSGSLLVMFVFWEVTALCSYALISFHNDDPVAVAGGIKALIVTQLGGIGLLAGALLGYAAFGTYDIRTFIEQAPGLPPAILSLAAFGFLAAAAAKSAQVPFHTWLPDAMEAPTPVTALIHAATMVNAGVYLLARFYPAFESVPGWKTAVVVVGLLSAVLAGLMAIVAADLKRALAYSTVSQLGYMVYAVGVGGVFASQFHLMSHSLFKALLFLAAGAVIHAVGTRELRKMGGLGKAMPFVRAAFVIGFLGLAGLPLANGFISKELVLEEGLAGGPGWAYAAMLACAGLTALYGARLVGMVFYGERRGDGKVHDAPVAMRMALGALSLGTATSWLLVGPFARMLASTLPLHEIHVAGTWEFVEEIVTAPATWLALAVVLFGLALWRLRDRLTGLADALRVPAGWARQGLGFEWANRQIINGIQGAAVGLRRLQTGHLAWNVVGIVIGLAAVLGALAMWG